MSVETLKEEIVEPRENLEIRRNSDEKKEDFDKLLKKFQRKCQQAGLMAEIRRRKHYEKPSRKRKRKKDEAKRKLAKKERAKRRRR